MIPMRLLVFEAFAAAHQYTARLDADGAPGGRRFAKQQSDWFSQ